MPNFSGIWTSRQQMQAISTGVWTGILELYNLYAWGAPTAFRGLNDLTVTRSSPVQVGTEATWEQIAVGWTSAAAIKSDGTLWRWGGNGSGQLGINSTIDVSSPVQVGALTNWANIAPAGSPLGKDAFGAVKTDGTLWVMGLGSMVPDNTNVDKSSPVQIGTDTNWSNAFGSHGYGSPMGMWATKTDGTLYGWGRRNNGSIGDSFVNVGYAASPASSPVQIPGTNWLQVCGGYYKGIGLKNNGQIWGWGTGGNAQPNTASPFGTTSPKQLGALTNWTALGVGWDTAHAINSAGQLYGWGRNTDRNSDGGAGILGDNTATTRTSPVSIGTDTNWSRVFVAGYATSSIFKRTNNTLWFAGESGVAGNNGDPTIKRSSPVQIGDANDWNVAGMNGTGGAGGGSIIGTRFTPGTSYT